MCVTVVGSRYLGVGVKNVNVHRGARDMVIHSSETFTSDNLRPLDEQGNPVIDWAIVDLYHQEYQRREAQRAEPLQRLQLRAPNEMPHVVRACEEHEVRVIVIDL